MENFNSTLYEIIGLRIKQTRKSLNYSQEQIAQKTNISRASISNIELGRHQPPLHVLYKIASILNYDIQLLIPTFNEVKNEVTLNDYSNILKGNNNLDDKSKLEIEEYINNLDK